MFAVATGIHPTNCAASSPTRDEATDRMTTASNPAPPLPPALRDCLVITEVDAHTGEFHVGPLFRRKLASVPPDVAHHLVALYRDADGGLHVAGYSHMRPFGDIYLSGGSCSDGDVIRRMTAAQREALY